MLGIKNSIWKKTVLVLTVFAMITGLTAIVFMSMSAAAETQYNEKAMKEKLAVAHRILAMEGHDDWLYGHMSFRVPGTNNFWMKASGMGLDEVTADSLLLLDVDGKVIGGSGKKSHSEWPIHAEIYRARPDVNAVIHTHPLYTTMLASMEQPLLSISNDAVMFINDQALYTKTSELITTPEAGKDVAKTIGKNRVLLIRNHGSVVVGDSIEQATVAAVFMERAAQTQVTCMAAGGKLSYASDKEIQRSRDNRISQTAGLFNYLAKKIDMKE